MILEPKKIKSLTVSIVSLSICHEVMRPDYCDIEWFTLEMNQDHSVIFEIVLKNCISDSSVDYEGYFISSKGFLPTVVDIIVI